MATRRGFLASTSAALLATPLWADAGAPAYLAAGKDPDGGFILAGLRHRGEIAFALPLPARGHAAAAHPSRPEAVAFARRPGFFAIVIDCRDGRVLARLEAPEDRHFYGHGAYSSDGSVLYTAENAYEEGDGRIGLWDASGGYARIGEVPSHGIGPHDLLRLPGSDILVVANGGIETHPASGRSKLNLPIMRPNVSYVAPDGALLEQVAPPSEWHLNSLRHLAVQADGVVAIAAQWQGDPAAAPPLLAIHRRGGGLEYLAADAQAHDRLQGYGGSVAFSGDGRFVALSSPRGGVVQCFELASGAAAPIQSFDDACGLAPGADGGFQVTTGTGAVLSLGAAGAEHLRTHAISWDNHLVALG